MELTKSTFEAQPSEGECWMCEPAGADGKIDCNGSHYAFNADGDSVMTYRKVKLDAGTSLVIALYMQPSVDLLSPASVQDGLVSKTWLKSNGQASTSVTTPIK